MINFATIGTSWITTSFINSAHATQQWKLSAVYSRSAETAQKFASEHKITTTFTTLDELASFTGIDAVYIASVNSAHFAQVAQMLRAGKHVIIEKPITSTPAEAAELFAIAKEKGVFLLEAFRHLHEANFRVLADLVKDQNRVGRICGATLNYASYSSRYNAVLAGETPNIFNLDLSGGALVDLGVYPISAAVALFGAPKAQRYTPVIVATGADGGGLITLEYEGFAVSVTASKMFTSTAPSEVYGEKGTVVVNAVTDIESVEFLDARSKERKQVAGTKHEFNLAEEAMEFARVIAEQDWDAARRAEELSMVVARVTADLRKQNGLIFGVEKE